MQFRGLGTEIFPHGVRTLSREQRIKTNKVHLQGHLDVIDTQGRHDVLLNRIHSGSLIRILYTTLIRR